MTEPSSEIMTAILADREARWQQRVSLAVRYRLPVATLTLNIPGADKHPPGTQATLDALAQHWHGLLDTANLPVIHAAAHDGADGPAIHLVVRGTAVALKRCAVALESNFPTGRLADVDVLDASGSPVGRQQLGLAPRTCMLCDAPAAVCMRSGHHTPAAVRDWVYQQLQNNNPYTVNNASDEA